MPQRFLFLQGPHGPFFDRLAKRLAGRGAEVWRAGFNAGDAAFWSDAARFIPVTGPADDWPARLAGILDAHGITDIVLYGDARPCHAAAVAAGRARGLPVHVFEEGYLRPYWITYERGGSNGNSPLMAMSVADMTPPTGPEPDAAPAHWGDLRQHLFWGALYHFHVLCRNGAYAGFRPHRALSVATEFRLYLRRLLLLPWHALERARVSARIRRGGFPYHLALLQLEHDSSFRSHGPFETLADFLEVVITGFAEGAPADQHLVVKAHPLDDGRLPLGRIAARLARETGIAGRVHFVRGGKLAALLGPALGAVTVNSTAGQQALWHGKPLIAFGRAVYAKPEFVSGQPLPAFFAAPTPPDGRAYRTYRRFLLATSQVQGGFYSARGRRELLLRAADLLLAPNDPYATRRAETTTVAACPSLVD